MADEKGVDFKVLCVALADPLYRHVDALSQVSPHKLLEIEQFFQTYKNLEDKSVEIDGWGGVAETLEILRTRPAALARRAARRGIHHEGGGGRLGLRPATAAGLPMATAFELIEVAGREVKVTNPDKVYWDGPGHTKLDLVRYYLAVADGALRGAGGRPMALKRFVNGAGGEFFFQKRAPDSRPDWIETIVLSFPSGRTAEEVVLRDAASLAWVANLGCLDLNPHPVRAEDLDHPDELRVDLDPVPGVPWSQVREVALVVREALESVGLVGWPKTSGSRGIHVNVRIEPRWTFDEVRRAALALARDVERRAPALATSQVVEGGAPRRLPRLQPERPGPHRRLGLLGAPHPGRARLHAAGLGRGARRGRRPTSPWPRCRALVAAARRPGRGHRCDGRLAGGAAGARGSPRGGGARRCPVAAALPQAGGRATRVQPSKRRAPAGVASEH